MYNHTAIHLRNTVKGEKIRGKEREGFKDNLKLAWIQLHHQINFRALSFPKDTVTPPMEKLRLRKDTTILGQSIASKGEFKDNQAHLRLNLTFIQSHMCPLKCRVHEFITLLQAKAKQTHALHTPLTWHYSAIKANKLN